MRYTDRNRRPRPAKPLLENVPPELQELKQWILWRYEWVEKKKEWSKVPRQANGDYAKSNTPATWSTFKEIQLAWVHAQASYDGIGFAFSKDSPVSGVDVDNCVTETEDGLILNEYALKTISLCDSYAEISPSGTGVHILGYGSLPDGFKDSAQGVEGYAAGRYFTFTGRVLFDYIPVKDINAGLNKLRSEFRERQQEAKPQANKSVQVIQVQALPLSVDERLCKAFAAENGNKLRRLYDGDIAGYDSQSEADLGLCGMLAFWCDGDANLLDRMFRSSKLYRDKWDEKHGVNTYGQMTVGRALSSQTEFYTATKIKTPKEALTETPESAAARRKAFTFSFKQMVPAMLQWRHTPALTGVSTGWWQLDSFYRPVKRYMSFVVGFPNHGKSNWVDALAVNMHKAEGWRFGYMSFETQPLEMHAAIITSLMLEKPYRPGQQVAAFTDDEALRLADALDDKFIFMAPPLEHMQLELLLPYVEDVMRDPGIDGLVFDPFSELSPPLNLRMNMTNFVQHNLTLWRSFTRTNDIHSWLIIHPAKEKAEFRKNNRIPDLRDCAESAHFHNKADYGISVHRPNYGERHDDVTRVTINKVRRGLPGKLGKLDFRYVHSTGGYIVAPMEEQQENDWNESRKDWQ